MPVLDPLEMLRKKQADEKPLVDESEALTLKNTSSETNAKILSALGRLPADDKEVNWDAMIARHAYSDVKSTNPILASSSVEFDVNSLIGFGLFSFDWTMAPFASKDAVVSWQSSKDKMYDKIVLRDDMTWSDGHAITAHDVAYSFLVIMSSKVPVLPNEAARKKSNGFRPTTIEHLCSFIKNRWQPMFGTSISQSFPNIFMKKRSPKIPRCAIATST